MLNDSLITGLTYNWKWIIYDCGFSMKVTCTFMSAETNKEIFKIQHFFLLMRRYLRHFYSNRGLKGNVLKLKYHLKLRLQSLET